MAYILLGGENKVLQENIMHKLEAKKKEPCDAKLYDFDDVFYRLFVDPEDRSKMLVSLEYPQWERIKDQGSEEWIREKLGDYITTVSNDGCKFEISLEDEKASENAQEVGNQFAKLRIYALGGPLYSQLKALASGNPASETVSWQIRGDTHLWIVPGKDRVACVFAFEFAIKSDKIIANQILQEFVEVRRQRDVSNTPVVSFSPKEAPMELRDCDIPSFNEESFLGYFSVLILESHIRGDKLETAVENIVGFRAYLTYHIKCAKAFFHQRMRARVKSMMTILNRARYEPDDQRKKKKIIVGAQ